MSRHGIRRRMRSETFRNRVPGGGGWELQRTSLSLARAVGGNGNVPLSRSLSLPLVLSRSLPPPPRSLSRARWVGTATHPRDRTTRAPPDMLEEDGSIERRSDQSGIERLGCTVQNTPSFRACRLTSHSFRWSNSSSGSKWSNSWQRVTRCLRAHPGWRTILKLTSWVCGTNSSTFAPLRAKVVKLLMMVKVLTSGACETRTRFGFEGLRFRVYCRGFGV